MELPALPHLPLTVTDQMKRRVTVSFPPRRIISLVPSQTELLFELGLGEQVVGVTKFCLHPAQARQQATIIGGTKDFHFDRIAALQPDLIIGNKEENYQEGIAHLATQYPVWMSDIITLAEALDMIRRVGFITGRKEPAEALAKAIDGSFHGLNPLSNEQVPAAYFIWRKPYMVAASGTFIDEMLRLAGFRNVFHSLSRYPEISAEQLAAARPQQILLSSEPYPFSHKHLAEFQAICPTAKIRIVDGELFSWYGSRLLQSAAYFRQLHT
ncbi:helical backbone metal receptor [Hymenobacter sp. BT730]|uniref:helical backbone metal receptor n=1 Tax=Hymenobacter sp. BT730 TaxID=3063332 RepID=UPI0026DF4EC2|nr:helical backbone metal receptor [Hymenobacter sp. BT730]